MSNFWLEACKATIQPARLLGVSTLWSECDIRSAMIEARFDFDWNEDQAVEGTVL